MFYQKFIRLKNQPKNIAVLCNSSSWGGLEMNVLRLANWLAEAGHSVWVLAPENSQAFQKAQENSLINAITFQSGFKYGNLIAARRLKKILKTNHIHNIISSHSKDINLMIISKIYSRNYLNVSYLQQMHLGIPKRDFFHTFFYKRLNNWIAPLPSIAETTLERTKISEAQIQVIPLCIEVENFSNILDKKEEARVFFNLSKQKKIIGTIGRLDAGKGQEYLIRSVYELRNEGYDVEALFIGDETKGEEGEYFPFLRYLIKDLGIESFIHFRPYTDKTDLAFAALDIFAMTSHNETFGMVTIEAMASQLPVVGSNAGGTVDLIEDEKTGLLFETKNAHELSKKLRIFLDKPEFAEHIAEEAQKSAQENYAHLRQVREFEKIIS